MTLPQGALPWWRVRLLLITPPMTQLNTPYPATAYLTGFLRQHAARLGLEVAQADAALELFLRLFSRAGIQRVLDELDRACRRDGATRTCPPSIAHFLEHGDALRRRRSTPSCASCRAAIPGFALRIVGARASARRARGSPRSTRAGRATTTIRSRWAFGALGIADRAKHLASLYIDDLADVIRDGIDPRLRARALRRAARRERADVRSAARRARGRADARRRRCSTSSTRELVAQHRPDVVGLTAPFPGNVYGAFRIARAMQGARAATRDRARRRLRQHRAARALRAARVRLLRLTSRSTTARRRCSRCSSTCATGASRCLRTFVREAARSCSSTDADAARRPARATPARRPTTGLPLDRYLSLFEMLNPMHRLWSDGRWNKLTIAHGCYWKKCTFCDVTLDYIAPLRPRARRPARRSHRGADRRDRPDRLSLRRRGGAAGGAAGARRAAASSASVDDHVVGQHPLREGVHARARASCSRAPAASRSAAGSRSRPIGCSSS